MNSDQSLLLLFASPPDFQQPKECPCQSQQPDCQSSQVLKRKRKQQHGMTFVSMKTQTGNASRCNRSRFDTEELAYFCAIRTSGPKKLHAAVQGMIHWFQIRVILLREENRDVGRGYLNSKMFRSLAQTLEFSSSHGRELEGGQWAKAGNCHKPCDRRWISEKLSPRR